jgi:hypothetical protein
VPKYLHLSFCFPLDFPKPTGSCCFFIPFTLIGH